MFAPLLSLLLVATTNASMVTSPSDRVVPLDEVEPLKIVDPSEVIIPPPQPADPQQGVSVQWSVEFVRRSAAEASPTASLLESERRALGCGLDCDDAAAAARVGLMQAVLHQLARRERNEAAGNAMELYYRILGLQQQRALLVEAQAVLEELIATAKKAEELEIRDGNPRELEIRRLGIEEQLVRANFGIRKLRRQLGRLIDQPSQVADSALLTDDLPVSIEMLNDEAVIAVALANRAELAAAQLLCRCWRAETNSAAKSLMGLLQPGLGLSAAVAALPTGLLARLHVNKEPPADLACRRQQCRLLQQTIADSIRSDALEANAELRQAAALLEIAQQTHQLYQQQASESSSNVEFEQAAPGSEKLDQLQALESEGELIQAIVDQAVAEVQLREAQGVLAD